MERRTTRDVERFGLGGMDGKVGKKRRDDKKKQKKTKDMRLE